MSVNDLITNYEAHLEANWTREGERKPSTCGMRWEDVGQPYYPFGYQPIDAHIVSITAENIEEIYSKPLPSPFMGMDEQDITKASSSMNDLMKSELKRLVPNAN